MSNHKEFIMSDDQLQAVSTFLELLTSDEHSEMLLTGRGGTGKTAVIKQFIAIAEQETPDLKLFYGESKNIETRLTSTTNKAVQVLEEVTNRECSTIHSLLGLRVFDNFHTGKTSLKPTSKTVVILDALIIIDEMSMVNAELLEIIRKQTSNCKIVWVGDSYQLAPVFENTCPVVDSVKLKAELTTVHRQNNDSGISKFAEPFREYLDTGKFNPDKDEHTGIIHCSPEEFKEHIDNSFHESMDKDDARIVTWTNSRVHQYNEYVSKLLGLDSYLTIGQKVLTNKPIMVGDRIGLSTDSISEIYDVFEDNIFGYDCFKVTLKNGVTTYQPKDRKQIDAVIKQYAKFKDWTNYFQLKNQFADLRPIYANTIQKSQGSTYKKVFIDVGDIAKNKKNSEIMRLMYVAITRASEKVYLQGSLPKRLLDGKNDFEL